MFVLDLFLQDVTNCCTQMELLPCLLAQPPHILYIYCTILCICTQPDGPMLRRIKPSIYLSIYLSRTEPSRAEQSRAEQNRTEQNRTEQNRTEQNRTEQNKTKQKKTKQNKTDITVQNKTKQNNALQNKTKQNWRTVQTELNHIIFYPFVSKYCTSFVWFSGYILLKVAYNDVNTNKIISVK